MNTWLVFVKTLREQFRNRAMLASTLLFAPSFVLLYWLILGGNASISYPISVLNQSPSGAGLVSAVENVRYPNGQALVRPRPVEGLDAGLASLRSRAAAGLLVIPRGFEGSRTITLYGDQSDPRYTLAAIAVQAGASDYAARVLQAPPGLTVTEQALSGSASRSEFEVYVPPLIILAVILTLFQAAVAFTRQLETGAARLMRLTSASTWEWLVGVSVALVIVSVAGQALTLAVAVALGFKAAGSILLALAPCAPWPSPAWGCSSRPARARARRRWCTRTCRCCRSCSFPEASSRFRP